LQDPSRLAAEAGERSFQEFRDIAERAFIEARLREHYWNVAETARALGMPRSNLYNKIEKYGLNRERA
jgi:DNA-binding NtrC family response regulator